MNNGVIVNDEVRRDEITIEEFADFIEHLIWKIGIEKFRITELFSKRGKYIYVIRGLHMEFEGEAVCCSDPDLSLIEHSSALLAFLESDITAQIACKNELSWGELYFLDGGFIMVEPI